MKKILSVFLALILAFSCLILSVSAASGTFTDAVSKKVIVTG